MQKKSFHFTRLNLPAAELNIEERQGRLKVYDPLRRRWLVLTDEEWVRQHFVAFMIRELGYPASVMANEVGLRLNDTLRRVDTIVFGPDGRPLVVVEFKAPDVDINASVMEQIVRYNLVLKAPVLIVSNGMRHYCCLIDHATGTHRYLSELPTYAEVKQIGL